MYTPSRHRPLVLAYDSNPSSDGSVLASATPPARVRARHAASLSAYTASAAASARVPSHALGQVLQQPVQQRVITLAQAVSGRHVLRDGSLWLNPRPRVNPAATKAQSTFTILPRAGPLLSFCPKSTASSAFSVLTQIGRTFRIPSDYVPLAVGLGPHII